MTLYTCKTAGYGQNYTGSATKATWSSLGTLKGADGEDGEDGTTPTIKVAAGSNIGSVGTPTVTATTSGTTTTFTFNYLKGETGDSSSSSGLTLSDSDWQSGTMGVYSSTATGRYASAWNGSILYNTKLGLCKIMGAFTLRTALSANTPYLLGAVETSAAMAKMANFSRSGTYGVQNVYSIATNKTPRVSTGSSLAMTIQIPGLLYLSNSGGGIYFVPSAAVTSGYYVSVDIMYPIALA